MRKPRVNRPSLEPRVQLQTAFSRLMFRVPSLKGGRNSGPISGPELGDQDIDADVPIIW